jgi:hypothetical protein
MGKNYTNYNEVPWFRRAAVMNITTLAGVLAFAALPIRSGGLIIALVILLFPTIVLFTGNAFVNKKKDDGTLNKWNLGIIPVIFLFLVILTLFFN